MSLLSPRFRQYRANRLVRLLAVAVLLAGIAHAAHFHQGMPAGGGDTHCSRRCHR